MDQHGLPSSDLSNGGTVTTVTASGPLSSSGGATPNISLSQANGTTDGYLSSADFTTFAAKLSDFSTLLSSDITSKLGYTPVNPTTAVTSVAGRIGVVTLSSGDISGLAFGTTAGTYAQGNDSRFTDTRTPTDNSVTSAKILDGTIAAADLSSMDASVGQVMKWNGSAWVASSDLSNGGTVTTVTASGPLSSSGGATPNISLSQANGTTDGYLSSADFTTFAAKLSDFSTLLSSDITSKLGYTPVNPSTLGSAALLNTNQVVLVSNMPANCNAGQALTFSSPTGSWVCSNIVLNSSSVTSAMITSLDWTKVVNTPTTAAGYGIPKATAAVDGYLSSADFTTFSNKLANFSTMTSMDVTTAIGYTAANSSDVSGKVSKSGDTMTGALNLPSNGLAVGTNQLVVSGGNVGIGTASPGLLGGASQGLTISHGTSGDNVGSLELQGSRTGSGAAFSEIAFYNRTNMSARIRAVTDTATDGAHLYFNTKPSGGSESTAFSILSNGYVGIGTTGPSYALQVSGDISISGNFKVNGTNINSGTVSSVTSANTDISVATGTTTPVLTLNSGTGNNQILKLNGTAQIPAVDGSLLTLLNATNLGSGTVPAARFPALTGDVTSSAGSVSTTIAANAVTSAKILDGTIASADLSSASVTAAKLESASNGQLYIGNGTGFTKATLTGTADQVTVTNGSGTITLSTPQSIATTSSPSFTGLTVSGITGNTLLRANGSGVLANATSADITGLLGTLPANKGGTGQSSYVIGDLLYASSTTALSKLAASTSGYVLTSNGVGAAPSWQAATTGMGGSGTTNYLPKFSAATSLTNSLIFDNGTNVSVGSASPNPLDARLQVFNDGSTPQLKIGDTGCGSCSFSFGRAQSGATGYLEFTANQGAFGLQIKTGSLAVGNYAGYPVSKLDVLGNASFGTYAYTNAAPANGLIVSGNVGIGTPSPSTQLANTATNPTDAAGLGISATGLAWLSNAAGYTATFTNTDATATYRNTVLMKTAATDTGSHVLKVESGGLNRFSVRADGNVGVGTASPSYKLDVAGDINVTGNFKINGTNINSGTVSSVTSANTDISVATTTTTPVLTLNSGTGANQILKLNGSSQIPAVNGSLLTSLNATNLGSGTVAAARMPALTGDVTMTVGTTATTIATDAVTSAKILDGTIASADLSSASVTAAKLESASNGQLYIGNGTGFTKATLTGTANQLNVTNGAGSITLSTPQNIHSAATPTFSGLTLSGITGNTLLRANGSGVLANATSADITGLLGFTPSNPSSSWSLNASGDVSRASGNVGVGQANPMSKFSVYGTASDGDFDPTMGLLVYGGSWANKYTGLAISSGGRYSTGSQLGAQFSIIGVNTKYNSTSDTLERNGTDSSRDSAMAITMNPYSSQLNGYRMGFWLGTSGNPSEKMSIAGTGNVGIGTTTPQMALDVRTPVTSSVIHPYRAGIMASGEGTDVTGRVSARTASSVEPPYFLAYRSRGTLAVPTAVQLNDTLGGVTTSTFDGSAWSTGGVGGLISFLADENWSSTNHGSSIAFTTTASGNGGATSERMRITSSGNVGIGTVSPVVKLEVLGSGPGASVATSGSSDATMNFRASRGTVGVDIGMLDNGTGYLQNRNIANFATNYNFSIQPNGGSVGVGTISPRATLDVTGVIVSRASQSFAAGTIDFSVSNLRHTTQNCGAFALHNLKDGGTYMFAVQGTTVATCSFTAFSDAGSTALTVHMPPDHAATTTGKHTIYNIAVMGTHAYIAWTPGY
jgi:hypothetical protein